MVKRGEPFVVAAFNGIAPHHVVPDMWYEPCGTGHLVGRVWGKPRPCQRLRANNVPNVC